jgi:hypothetical protein
MHNAGGELRRIPLPRTWVNKMVAYLLSVLTGQEPIE